MLVKLISHYVVSAYVDSAVQLNKDSAKHWVLPFSDVNRSDESLVTLSFVVSWISPLLG